jgi:hypothetical protein
MFSVRQKVEPSTFFDLITGKTAEEDYSVTTNSLNTQFCPLFLFIFSVLVSNKLYINRWSNEGTLCLFVCLLDYLLFHGKEIYPLTPNDL